MPKATISWDETDKLDIVYSFRNKVTITNIAKDLAKKKKVKEKAVSRHKVVALLQEAFEDRLVSLQQQRDKEGKKDLVLELLKERYKDVEFRLIYSDRWFSQIAAYQVLNWLVEACSRAASVSSSGSKTGVIPSMPMIAVGGGQAMADLVEEIPAVLGDPANRHLKESINFSLINATSGGQPRKPELNASYVSCRFGLALRAGLAGEKPRDIPVMSHTTAMNPTDHEKDVVREATSQTCAIVSGLGALSASYCIDAIWPLLTDNERARVVGELLFHVYDRQGKIIPVDEIAAKDDLPDNWAKSATSKHKRGRGRTQESDSASDSPMLTTLFKYESLRGRPNPAKCAVIVVVKSTSETMNSKAAALRVMLDNGFLTNVALSADLAHAVVSESAG